MECGLVKIRTLREICKVVCFSTIFVWVVIGSYKVHFTKEEGIQDLEAEGRILHVDTVPGARTLLGRSQFHVTSGNNRTLYTIDPNAECYQLHSLPKNNQTLLCEFVTIVKACGGDGGFIPYFKFVYCWMPLKLIPLSMVILFFWLLYLFIFLGTTAEEYFCPALTIIAQILRLSQNIAGVTLLAFGNGAPDIFSALAAINQPDVKRASLAFGALFGAGMFVCNVVVGAVIITKPFTLTRRPFMRDLIFYLAACYWTFFILWNNFINIWISIGFILMYLVYVCVVVFGRIIYQKWKKRSISTGDIPRPPKKQQGKEMSSSYIRPTTLIPNGQDHTKPPNEHNASGRSDDLTHSGEVMNPSNVKVIDSEVEKGVNQYQTSVTVEVHGDSDNSRCSTPNQRCASRASQAVYGVSSEEKETDSGVPRTTKDYLRVRTQQQHTLSQEDLSRRSTPTASPRKLRKTISGALNITEDVGLTAIGTPNLSKIWHHAYRKELVHESTSRGSTPLSRPSPITGGRSPISHLSKEVHSASYQKSESDQDYSSNREDEEDVLLESDSIRRRKRELHPFLKLLLAFWPFGETFQALRIWGKVYELIKYPANVILLLTVPVIDRDEELDNWNRWLNTLQCVLAPVFISLTTNFGLILIKGVFPVAAIVFVAGVCFAIFVAFTSRNDASPKYHCVFAWLGFGVAVVWIYSIANEIVNVLQVFGVVVDISDGILGITLLAWGNSIGDAVANVTMARQGFPRMAFGACYGGPLLNMLLGIGLAATVKSARQKSLSFPLYFTQVQMFAALFLLFALTTSLIVTSVLRFKMRRPYGILLCLLYVVFLLVVILAEVKVFNITIDNVLSPF